MADPAPSASKGGLRAALTAAARLSRRLAQRRHEGSPRAAFLASSVCRPASFAVIRILGNDLLPRHAHDQTLQNLRFILDNEPELDNCRKLYVINRLFSPGREREIIAMLETFGARYVRIPFSGDEYAATGWSVSGFDTPGFFESDRFERLSQHLQTHARIWACSNQVRYAMNVNGARNVALQWGATLADWTVPLDSNCIFDRSAFDALADSCAERPDLPCRIVPMLRVSENADFFRADLPVHEEEPQLALHRFAGESFDPAFPYGLEDKSHLLKRLEVEGPWQRWKRPPWMPVPSPSPNRHLFSWTGAAVKRLSSGPQGLERPLAQPQRYRARNLSILNAIRLLNEEFGTADPAMAQRVLGPLRDEDLDALSRS
ncbi:hypothetical protein [Aquibium sp. ELW1220]|uniref:hypothetical protein n=1 Tax=Aquibium sp. ELW1220 TaxID=2976766 RepID=UPI0025B069F7|nr:hypothetical protein [Aquibium sp. ELW1220]MDN2584210.1 hypothetical protein [Aquibium sp. ELW1220]